MTAPLPPPPPAVPEPVRSRPWWQKWWVIVIAVLVVLIAIGAIFGGDDEDDASPATTATAAAPETSPSSTAAPATEAPPASLTDEQALNGAWAATARDQASEIVGILDRISTHATNLDEANLQVACTDLIPAAQAFADGAPDTEAGQHARAAANLFVQGSAACLAGDYDSATTFFLQGGDEIEKSGDAVGA